ncbi:MAG: DUF1295 domain-containing protein [Hyphomicrobiales bacterium]
MTLLLLTFLVTLCAFSCIWLVQVKTKDAGIVDFYWGPGFAIIVFIYLLTQSNLTVWHSIFAIITATWALRLGLHMWLRHRKFDGEDRRYAAMRMKGGRNFWWVSWFKVFLLQAILMWIIASSHHVAFSITNNSTHETNISIFFIGLGLFVTGFALETIADYQLSQFKDESKNAGKTMNQGLWAWSRHPNYFGETVLWWGFGFCSFALSGVWWAFIGPALLTFLLLRVSGVTLLEKHLKPAKEGYEEYIKTTSAFIPLPPKR